MIIVLLSLLQPLMVDSHGYLNNPPARNVKAGPRNGYCPHCGNGDGICGDGNQWPASSDYLNYYAGPVKTWTAGTVVEVEVKLTAHHKGHYEFSVCDQVLNGTMQNAQACLDKWILEHATPEEAGLTDCKINDKRPACLPVDPRHKERFYVPPPNFDGTNTHRFYLKLPVGLSCAACTLQWRWWSANSCIPAPDYACFGSELAAKGYSVAIWGLGNSCLGGGCDRCGCGEEFRNCADVKIVPSGPTPPPTPAPPTPPTSAPTPAPPTPVAPSPTTPLGGSCVQNPDCSTNAWCNDPTYVTWCPLHDVSQCPTPQCMLDGNSGTEPSPMPSPVTPDPTLELEPEPEPEPESEPTEVPTPAPTTPATPTPVPTQDSTPALTPRGVMCVATPALNRGVSDADCARCADGYKTWPCNEDILCQCSGSELVQFDANMEPKRRAARAEKVGIFLAPDHAMLQLPCGEL